MSLAAQGYTYQVDRNVILDEVSLAIRPGERFAIIGPNGAGKSTLLKSFCRLLPLGQGSLTLDGRPIGDLTQKELARRVAYVPQAGGRDDLFTVWEFVLMGRYPHLSPFTSTGLQDREAVQRALELTQSSHLAHRRLGTLSGGEQQKALIAAAVAQESRILLLDEPTAFLDPRQQEQIADLLDRLWHEGLTLVEVTHDVNRAALRHDRILGLRAGRVVFEGTPRELMHPNVLWDIYEKKFTLMAHPVNGQQIVMPEAA